MNNRHNKNLFPCNLVHKPIAIDKLLSNSNRVEFRNNPTHKGVFLNFS